MKIRYVGNAARIDYPVVCERGKTIEVPAALGRALVKQASWEKVTPPKKKKAEE